MGGLEIHRAVLQVPMGALVADRPLCVDRTLSVLVEDGSPESAYLLVGKGQVIQPDDVKRLGLRMAEGRVVQSAEPVKAPEPKAAVEPEPIMPPESKRSKGK